MLCFSTTAIANAPLIGCLIHKPSCPKQKNFIVYNQTQRVFNVIYINHRKNQFSPSLSHGKHHYTLHIRPHEQIDDLFVEDKSGNHVLIYNPCDKTCQYIDIDTGRKLGKCQLTQKKNEVVLTISRLLEMDQVST